MRSFKPQSIVAGLLAGNLLAVGALGAVPAHAGEARPAATIFRTAAAAQEPGGPLRSAERARYCAQTYPADFYDAWVKNSCSKAPYGPKFEYLTSAWRCLCLGHG